MLNQGLLPACQSIWPDWRTGVTHTYSNYPDDIMRVNLNLNLKNAAKWTTLFLPGKGFKIYCFKLNQCIKIGFKNNLGPKKCKKLSFLIIEANNKNIIKTSKPIYGFKFAFKVLTRASHSLKFPLLSIANPPIYRLCRGRCYQCNLTIKLMSSMSSVPPQSLAASTWSPSLSRVNAREISNLSQYCTIPFTMLILQLILAPP